jgi:hypothetical protein
MDNCKSYLMLASVYSNLIFVKIKLHAIFYREINATITRAVANERICSTIFRFIFDVESKKRGFN